MRNRSAPAMLTTSVDDVIGEQMSVEMQGRSDETRGRRSSARRTLAICVAVALAAVLLTPAQAMGQDRPDPLPDPAAIHSGSDRVVVLYEPGTRPAERAAARAAADVERVRTLGDPQFEVVRVDGTADVDRSVEALRRSPDVLAADPDQTFELQSIPDDPLFDQLWGLRNTGQPVAGASWPGEPVADADIDAELAWDRTVGSSDVTVAVLDSGYSFLHPDLAPVAWTNTDEVPGNGADDDANGYVDDTRGWDVLERDNDPSDPGAGVLFGIPFVYPSHGTHVAGTVGAKGGNGVGVSGAAQDLRLMPIRVCENLNCSLSAIIEGVAYAGANGANAANLSITGYLEITPRTLTEAIASQPQTLFVAAAGNAALDTDGDGPRALPCTIDPTEPDNSNGYVPRSGAVDNVVCVAASDRTDSLASFSNFGRDSVDLAAPGTDILSTSFSDDKVYDTSTGPQWTDAWTTPPTTPGEGFVPFDPGSGRYLVSDPPSITNQPQTHQVGVTRATQSPPIQVAPAYRTCRAQFRYFAEFGGDDEFRWTLLVDGQELVDRREPAVTDWLNIRVADTGTIELPATTSTRSLQLRVSFTRGSDGVDKAAVAFQDPSLECRRTDNRLDAGTSMAAPHVAGVAGLLFSLRPNATVTEVRDALLAGVDPLPSLAGTTVTGGRLNAWGALQALAPMDTRITVGPDATSRGDVTFEFDSFGSGPAGFECSLDGGPYSVCTSPVSYRGLGDGEHTLAVRSALPGGSDTTPATRSWIVDATAPALRPIVAPDPVLVGGTATASAGASDTGSGVASSSCSATSTATPGRRSVSCTATDRVGNTASANAGYTVGVGVKWVLRPSSIRPEAGLSTLAAVQLTDVRGRALSPTVARRLPPCAVRFQLAAQPPGCATYEPLSNSFVAVVTTRTRLTVGSTVDLRATVTVDATTVGSNVTAVRVVRR